MSSRGDADYAAALADDGDVGGQVLAEEDLQDEVDAVPSRETLGLGDDVLCFAVDHFVGAQLAH